MAALFYSWSIRYIVNRALVTVPQLVNWPQRKKSIGKRGGYLQLGLSNRIQYKNTTFRRPEAILKGGNM